MELIAEKRTVCPGCDSYIMPGDTITPYAGMWYHNTCDFTPISGTTRISAHAASVQQRTARILKYARRYPSFSVRDLADHLGYSKSTVQRTLQAQARGSRQAAFRVLVSGR